MARLLAGRAEIVRRAHEPVAEEVQPDAIHRDARGERVRRRGEPLGEFEAAAGVAVESPARVPLRQHRDEAARHGCRAGWSISPRTSTRASVGAAFLHAHADFLPRHVGLHCRSAVAIASACLLLLGFGQRLSGATRTPVAEFAPLEARCQSPRFLLRRQVREPRSRSSDRAARSRSRAALRSPRDRWRGGLCCRVLARERGFTAAGVIRASGSSGVPFRFLCRRTLRRCRRSVSVLRKMPASA